MHVVYLNKKKEYIQQKAVKYKVNPPCLSQL